MDPIFHFFFCEALAVWQWFKFLCGNIPVGRTRLVLNLDETCVRFFYEPRVGVRARKHVEATDTSGFKRHSSRGQLRRAVTHVAVICDDTSIQPKLPQIILVAEKSVAWNDIKSWRARSGSDMRVWRQKSAWVNKDIFVRIIKEIARQVRAAAPQAQPILLMDAHAVHACPEVLRAARREKVWLCFIPASTTGLLQPLDTDVFARYKHILRTMLHQHMLTDANKDIKALDLLNILQGCIRGVLQKHAWQPVFAKNGFGTGPVRQSLLQKLGWLETPNIPCSLPKYEQFAVCFAARRHIPFSDLLCSVVDQHRPRLPSSATKRRPPERDPSPKTWGERLRPRKEKKSVAELVGAAPAASSCGHDMKEIIKASHAHEAVLVEGPVLKSVRPFPPRKRRSESELDLCCAVVRVDKETSG